MIPAGTAIGVVVNSIAPTLTHTAISTPMLRARAVSILISDDLLARIGVKRRRLSRALEQCRERAVRMSCAGPSVLHTAFFPGTHRVQREDYGTTAAGPTVRAGPRPVKLGTTA